MWFYYHTWTNLSPFLSSILIKFITLNVIHSIHLFKISLDIISQHYNYFVHSKDKNQDTKLPSPLNRQRQTATQKKSSRSIDTRSSRPKDAIIYSENNGYGLPRFFFFSFEPLLIRLQEAQRKRASEREL